MRKKTKTASGLLNKIIWIIPLFIAIESQAQWTNINSLSSHYFMDVVFPTTQTGFAIVSESITGVSSLQKTSDTGISWQEIPLDFSPIHSIGLQSINFLDENIGFLAFRGMTNQYESFLYKTEDSGVTWSEITPDSLPVGYGLSDVVFPTLNRGFVTSGNRLYRTEDGGSNWSTYAFGGWGGPMEIDFLDADKGIAGAWDGTFAYKGMIYFTGNGGATWDSLILDQAYSSISDVCYADGSTAYAMTEQGWFPGQKIFKTTDNGSSWDTLHLTFLMDSMDQAMDMYFLNAWTGYLSTSKGYVYKTDDGGSSWVVDHFESGNLSVISSNGNQMFIGGSLNTLITNANAVGISPMLINDVLFSVFPNPVSKTGNIQFAGNQSLHLVLLDGYGKEVCEIKRTGSQPFQLKDLDLKTGIYFLRAVEENKNFQKIVVY